ncbi:MAG: proline--tRNA ligase [Patescibacteria group bacterium]|nr:proline--tRNA ligase [Patescibacteria group bacterium]
MLYSKLFAKTLRDYPKSAETISHKYLARGGFIDQLMSGVYTYLPLGWRVHTKISNIIREEMNKIGGQEILMPALQKKSQWLETGRWDKIDPPLFKFKDRHNKELALGPTHEEVVTDLARRFVGSYKDLPFAVYQIQNKFRNEMRAVGGLLRVREFVMKDMYSFHKDKEDFADFYKTVIKAYFTIFERCGLKEVRLMDADSGSIGGEYSNEFGVPCENGEDKMYVCKSCDWAGNVEAVGDKVAKCPKCGGGVVLKNNVENGHIFMLGTEYSEAMKAYFTDKDGVKKPLVMGCYGIGLGRLMATIVEQNYDDKGIIWPENVAPFDYYLTYVEEELKDRAFEYYKKMLGVDVLFDDRSISIGTKFADCDLLGIPKRIVISKKSIEQGGVEIKDRRSGEVKIDTL